jgi:TetR/AcrR family transcriptional regulator, tetracycline repressor protein
MGTYRLCSTLLRSLATAAGADVVVEDASGVDAPLAAGSVEVVTCASGSSFEQAATATDAAASALRCRNLRRVEGPVPAEVVTPTVVGERCAVIVYIVDYGVDGCLVYRVSVPRRRPVPLNRTRIASAALHLVDSDGVDGLTMRSLGRRLGCDPMAVYRHVDDRDDLLALVAAQVIDDIEAPEADLTDREWLRAAMRNFRAACLRHPNAITIIGNTLLPNTTRHPILDQFVERLGDNPLRGVALADRVNALLGAMVGYVMIELAQPSAERSPRIPRLARAAPANRYAGELEGAALGFRSEPDPTLTSGGFELLADTLLAALVAPVHTEQAAANTRCT